MKVLRKVQKLGAVLVGSLAALPVFATSSFDLTTVTSAITDAATAVGTLGAAVIAGPIIVAKGWKWVRKGM